MEKGDPCVVMVPCPGFSHLIPLIELAKRLVVHHPDFHVTFLIPTFGAPPSSTTLSILQSLPANIEFTVLPQVNQNDMPPNAFHPVTHMNLTVTYSLPSLHQALISLNSRTHLVAMIADVFSVDALEVAKQFNLKTYAYCASSGASLSFHLNFLELDKDLEIASTEFPELQRPVKLPGCVALQGKDLMDSVQERASESYKTILHISKGLDLADGIILNSYIDLERKVITTLQESNHKYPPIYPLGPILQSESASLNESDSLCLKWLDNQPPNSVLYVSFGSGGTLSQEQLNELALGLEMSGHKFLWATRAPNRVASSAYLCAQKEDPLDYLPKGFHERTKDRGLVVPSWAPQIEVLRHKSTGGFLTHSGWNSTLEGVFYGKPMIVWPLFAEQRMNAVILTEELKIAVRPKENENNNGIVEKEEVSRIVKSVLEGDEGKEINKRIQVFKNDAVKALGKDGSFTRALTSLALQWKNLSGK
ncbi:hydroquinone glucosyltransferase-like [Prosopis cineraria]|uniref:hydroquinone glucosyltransferase-like n=1 Tax=Prosopis cineraria TaxID=364024 RepID=UPI00240F3637|nr:hydroquinone glucosyltransferase-like [Prosopis cineraria]